MKHKKVKLSVLLLLGISMASVQAQEAVSASGGDASGSGGTVNYTIGQTVYTINNGSDGTVSQGVQQPFEFFVTSVAENAQDINLGLATFPNPTTDYLTIKVENYANQNLSYQLYDMSGKLLDTQRIADMNMQVDMTGRSVSTYFLRILDNGKEIKTFKVIKN